ncbi:MAG: hypothetical protein HQM08_29225 [Candidatus Riflebacteria bacterium]|nr:hypothetical protein [Candidatus Riflebacteria bacterium]
METLPNGNIAEWNSFSPGRVDDMKLWQRKGKRKYSFEKGSGIKITELGYLLIAFPKVG